MALVAFNVAKQALAEGGMNFGNESTDLAHLRVILVETGSTVGSAGQEDVTTLQNFTTLGEFTGTTGYTAGTGYAVVNTAVATDTVNDRAELDVDDIVWTGFGTSGDPNVIGMLLFWWNGAFATSIPVAYYDSTGFPFSPNGSNLSIVIGAEGLLHIT